MSMAMDAISSWPSYLSHEEDKLLRAVAWKNDYGKKRMILWRTTDVRLCSPSSAELRLWPVQSVTHQDEFVDTFNRLS